MTFLIQTPRRSMHTDGTIRTIGGIAALVAAVSACEPDRSVARPPDPLAPAAALPMAAPVRSIAVSPEAAAEAAADSALVEAIVAYLPAMHRAAGRAALGPRAGVMSIRADGNPALQRLVDELMAGRRAASDAYNARAAALARRGPLATTIAVIDNGAVVPAGEIHLVRRANRTPHDVIAVGSAALTPERLVQAVRALQKVRRTQGDVPTADVQAVVSAVAVTGASGAADPALRYARRDVARLLGAERRHMADLGTVRSIDVRMW